MQIWSPSTLTTFLTYCSSEVENVQDAATAHAMTVTSGSVRRSSASAPEDLVRMLILR